MNTATFTAADYRAAVAAATAAALAYYDGIDELMTDIEYDELTARIEAFEAEHPSEVIPHTLGQVAAGVAGVDVTHTEPMLSLDKTKTHDKVRDFVDSMFALDSTVVLEPKLDGLALSARYVDGVLTTLAIRGDGTTGEDVTDRVLSFPVANLPRTVGVSGAFEVRGELVMSAEDFEFSRANRIAAGEEDFKNPRNAVAGIVRKGNPGYDVRATFIAYDFTGSTSDNILDDTDNLRAVGFTTAFHLLNGGTVLSAPDDVIDAIEFFGEYRRSELWGYPTDGIVIKAVLKSVQRDLGSTSRAPRWALAYKYKPMTGFSVLRDILVEVGGSGNISYTALYDPVDVDGSTLSRASLHNPNQIALKDLRIGDTIEVHKANDIIPQVIRSLPEWRTDDSIPYVASTLCPVSGTPLDMSGAIWRSTDPAAALGGAIAYAASREALDIDGLGDEIANALAASGLVESVADLFTLDYISLVNLSLGVTENGTKRFLGEKTAKKLLTNIEGAKKQPLNRVITSLSIRKTGTTFGRRLASHFKSMDDLVAASYDDFLTSGVEGIGPERARLFHEGFQRLTPVIAKLASEGVTVAVDDSATAQTLLTDDGKPLKVCVTGAMTGPFAGKNRTQANELIAAHGGSPAGSVSKATHVLVCDKDSEGSTKHANAVKLGIPVLTPEKFADLIAGDRSHLAV